MLFDIVSLFSNTENKIGKPFSLIAKNIICI